MPNPISHITSPGPCTLILQYCISCQMSFKVNDQSIDPFQNNKFFRINQSSDCHLSGHLTTSPRISAFNFVTPDTNFVLSKSVRTREHSKLIQQSPLKTLREHLLPQSRAGLLCSQWRGHENVPSSGSPFSSCRFVLQCN